MGRTTLVVANVVGPIVAASVLLDTSVAANVVGPVVSEPVASVGNELQRP